MKAITSTILRRRIAGAYGIRFGTSSILARSGSTTQASLIMLTPEGASTQNSHYSRRHCQPKVPMAQKKWVGPNVPGLN